ncbi:FkbM family methyltransferase [Streptomyces boncukensis]|uniref:FkbM family methyltransferase n=1 Tax=Streptomyces boncukensis TaxID=2711219 RepID=A0A6G4X1J6_9ACTN|nr:FkbM family methyltransferase [Streptomyces boncukensis]NGO70760.1 FkbM family methyltransferase [Streptomyces boncukensis]
MGLDYLRTDTDRTQNVSLGRIAVRETLGCLTNLALGARYGQGVNKLSLPYWMLRAHIGAARTPLDSEHQRVMTLETPRGPAHVCVRENQSDLLILWQVFLQRFYELDCMYACAPVDRLDTVIDLGGNTGLSAAYLAARYRPSTLVVAEPIPENLAVLRRNAALSDTPWTIVPNALAGERGRLAFAVSGMWCNCTSVDAVADLRRSRPYRLENTMERPSITVDAITMDDLLEQNGIEHVDLLKVDTEGGEADTFARPQPWMAKVDRIVVEIHDKYIDGAVVRRTLAEAGFRQIPARRAEPDSPNPLELYARA